MVIHVPVIEMNWPKKNRRKLRTRSERKVSPTATLKVIPRF
jgi:hypothetical protein